MGQERALLARIKDSKMKYFGHITHHKSLEKDTMLGPMLSLCRQGGRRRQWLDYFREWTEMNLTQLVHAIEDRTSYRILTQTVAYTPDPRVRYINIIYSYTYLLRTATEDNE